MKTNRLLLLLILTCIATALAVDPPPDGGYPNENTAEGEDALFSLNAFAGENTALGYRALFNSTSSSENTAIGDQALFSDTTGSFNVALGWHSLSSNTTGEDNVALGNSALALNTTGESNVAVGPEAMFFNRTGFGNVGIGPLVGGGGGDDNVAIGDRAMANTDEGSFNTAVGYSALSYCTGSHNIALGEVAGVGITEGSQNIDIGNKGLATDHHTIRIGNGTQHRTFVAGITGVTVPHGVAVMIEPDGQLGTVTSSARYKEAIKPMDKASEAILALKPVTFRYKHELDPKGIPQFGLVAEEVEKVNPALVARDEQGKPYSVRYDAVNAMLLNEFLKEHRKVETLEATVVQQQKDFQAITAEQQREIKALTASLTEQAAQIQKVSAQLAAASLSGGGLEARKSSSQLVLNNPVKLPSPKQRSRICRIKFGS